jgi:hypothetical protein
LGSGSGEVKSGEKKEEILEMLLKWREQRQCEGEVRQVEILIALVGRRMDNSEVLKKQCRRRDLPRLFSSLFSNRIEYTAVTTSP